MVISDSLHTFVTKFDHFHLFDFKGFFIFSLMFFEEKMQNSLITLDEFQKSYAVKSSIMTDLFPLIFVNVIRFLFPPFSLIYALKNDVFHSKCDIFW